MSEANIDEILENETAEEEGGELYEHIRIVVDKGQALERIDTFLTNHIQNISRNRVQNAAKAGNILVNEKAVKQNYKVKPNDVISIVFSYPPRETDIKPQQIPLEIVYEDDDVIVINKQAGLVVHPGHGNFDGTLLNGLAYHFEQTRQNVENKFGYLVHRIDKDTTGLLLVAKNETAQAILARQFFDHSIDRRYQTIVWGNIVEDEGTVESNICRDPSDRTAFKVTFDEDKGKHAVTHYRVLERFGYVTLLECKLETGRTHQIRVHMAHLGHPIFGDERYGGMEIRKGTIYAKYKQFIRNCFEICPRQALHAKTLGFVHPVTGKWLQFDSRIPEDMTALLEKWRKYSGLMPEEDEE